MVKRKLIGPLDGVKILDFTEVLSGPYCTQMLADLGAEIIKVEPPWGDETRKWGTRSVSDKGSYFLSLNRNKKSIAIDLSKEKPEGRKVVLSLARDCQVLVENFRPGVMKRLGLGYDAVRKVNPSIIYCSISGYGQYGPLSYRPGYDIAAYAASGIMSITGEERGGPIKTGVPIADIGAGLTAALAISSSLYGARKKGGTYIDISLYDTMISWLTFQAGYYFATGKNPKRLGSAHPLLVPYQAFRAFDRYFILAVGNDNIWQRACKAINRDDLANDPRFATAAGRVLHRDEIVRRLERIFKTKKARYWLEAFDKSSVPCSSIQTVKEALESDHTRQRKLVLNLGDKVRTIASPIHFQQFGNTLYAIPPPRLGENTKEILNEFGFSRNQIELLLKERVVFSNS